MGKYDPDVYDGIFPYETPGYPNIVQLMASSSQQYLTYADWYNEPSFDAWISSPGAKILACPNDVWFWDYFSKETSYGYPFYTWTAYPTKYGPPAYSQNGIRTKFSNVRRPTETVLLAELLPHGGFYSMDGTDQLANCVTANYIINDYGDAMFWHGSITQRKYFNSTDYYVASLNYLFFDGHVETRSQPPYSFNQNPGGANNPWNLQTYAELIRQ